MATCPRLRQVSLVVDAFKDSKVDARLSRYRQRKQTRRSTCTNPYSAPFSLRPSSRSCTLRRSQEIMMARDPSHGYLFKEISVAGRWTTGTLGRMRSSSCESLEADLELLSNGIPLPSSADCDESQAQRFIYNTGATTIQVSGTNLCVEFGPGLGVNGRPLRVQNCRSNGAPGQRLFITDDNHIALQNGPGQCADVTDGGESAQLQSWRCASDNINQVRGL